MMAIEEIKRNGNDTVVVIRYEKNKKLYEEAESTVRRYEEAKDGNPIVYRIELNKRIDALLLDIRAQDEKILAKYMEAFVSTGSQPIIQPVPDHDTDRLIEKMLNLLQSSYHRN